jgi:tetratricopeptide (TPR) repeat protein
MRYLLTISFFLLSLAANAQLPPDYFLEKAVQSYQDKDFQSSINYTKSVLKQDSSEQRAYHILSSSYMGQHNWTKGIESAQLGLIHFPNSAGLHWLMAEGALQSKKYQVAATHYEQVKTHFSVQKEIAGGINLKELNLRMGECYTQLGNEAMKQGAEKVTITHFKKANQLLSDNAFSYLNLSFAYAQAEQWNASQKIAEEGLSKFPSNDDLRKAKASALYHKKDYQGVEKEYKKLHESNPRDLTIAIAYGELLMANQQFQKASELYNDLLKSHPKEEKIYESLITSYEARLNYEGKVSILSKMLTHFDNAVIYQRIASTYEQIEQWVKAQMYYDTLLSLHPSNSFEIEKKLAATYVQQDSLDEAALRYKALLQKEPQNTKLLRNLATVYEKDHNWVLSLRYYQQLETLEKSHEVYTKLGKVNYALDNEAEALKYYEKSLVESKSPEALLGVAKIIRATEPDTALFLSEQAFRLAFEELSQYESEINSKLGGNNSMAGLIANKDLLKEIEASEQLATDAFQQLASFDFDQVSKQIASLTDDFPKSARVFYLVGDFYFKNKKEQEAYISLSQSARLNPNFKDTQLLLGAIYEERQDYYQSILSYERALTLDAQDGATYSHLIRLYRAYNKLDLLCEKWLVKYEASNDQEALKPYLLEALHKAGKDEMARKIIQEGI